ncbi:hypothetical protein [Brevibacillus daliensis]|uniref:hypothetical protein n=1 Tax=Brevibacillus daliensis TaxID=2892995 RepID=UPI001E4743BD|nr:hypothetical protein [Brevibacillus daliensis]
MEKERAGEVSEVQYYVNSIQNSPDIKGFKRFTISEEKLNEEKNPYILVGLDGITDPIVVKTTDGTILEEIK